MSKKVMKGLTGGHGHHKPVKKTLRQETGLKLRHKTAGQAWQSVLARTSKPDRPA